MADWCVYTYCTSHVREKRLEPRELVRVTCERKKSVCKREKRVGSGTFGIRTLAVEDQQQHPVNYTCVIIIPKAE
jgi:hypothetical protein